MCSTTGICVPYSVTGTGVAFVPTGTGRSVDCLTGGKIVAQGLGAFDLDATNSHIRVADVSVALSENAEKKVVLGAGNKRTER